MDAVQLLEAGRGLIEKGWCKGTSARDKRGMPTPFGGPAAVSFCMSGALCHLMNPVLPQHQAAMVALKKVVGHAVAAWNDHYERTQAEVLAAYDAAIAILKEAP